MLAEMDNSRLVVINSIRNVIHGISQVMSAGPVHGMCICVSVMFWCVSCYYFRAFLLLCVAHVYHVLPPAIKRACICIAVKSSYVIPLVYKSVFSLLVVVLVRVIPTTVVKSYTFSLVYKFKKQEVTGNETV